MLDLYKLKIFRTAAEEGSLTAAADYLHLSQPGVSQHVKDLEASLGVTLFERGRRGVKLTAAGQILFDYTRCIFKMLGEAETAVAQVGQISKRELHIGATEEIGIYVMPEWLGEFHQRYHNLRVKLHTLNGDAIIQQVMNGQLDLGFIDSQTPTHSGLEALFLQDVTLRVIVNWAHPWATRDTVSMEELSQQPFLIHSRTDQDWLAKEVDVVASFDSLEAIKKAVNTGMGAAMVPACAIAREEANGQLHSLAVSDAIPARFLSVIWSTDQAMSPIAKAFLIYLAEPFPQLAKVMSDTSVPQFPEIAIQDSFRCLIEED